MPLRLPSGGAVLGADAGDRAVPPSGAGGHGGADAASWGGAAPASRTAPADGAVGAGARRVPGGA